MDKRDFFLCHSSEDKKDIVLPVAESLKQMGRTIWIDEAELTVGDILIEKIQDALKKSLFVVTFISRSSIKKGWPLQELFAALAVEIAERRKIILPIVIDLSHKELTNELPFIADKVYLKWNGNPHEISEKLCDIFNKEKFINRPKFQTIVECPSEYKWMQQLVDTIYLFLRCDQNTKKDFFYKDISKELLKYEGDWGKSVIACWERLVGVPPSDLVKWQGGITTTTIVANTLYEFEQKYFCVRDPIHLPYLSLTKKALLSAQHPNGGFGSLVRTRYGIEPHPTYRHTATIITFLERAHAPRNDITRGLEFLDGFIETLSRDPLQDHCPVLALAWLYEALNISEELGYIKSEKKVSTQKSILMILAQIDDSYYPYWKPYAGSKKALFWTALSAFIICSDILKEKPLRNRTLQIVKKLLKSLRHSGLPSLYGGNYPDIGMTSMFALAIHKFMAKKELLSSSEFKELTEIFESLMIGIEQQRNDERCYLFSWAETLISILQLGMRFNLQKTIKDKRVFDEYVENIVNTPSWSRGDILVPDHISEQFPVLEGILANVFKGFPRDNHSCQH